MHLVDGLDLSRYKRNPMLLAEHDRHRPIGRTTSLVRQGSTLVGKATLTAGDPEAELAYRRMQQGVLNGISLAFLSFQTGLPR